MRNNIVNAILIKWVFLLSFVLLSIRTEAQLTNNNISLSNTQEIINNSTANFIISDIIISGNRKTKDYIILREMKMKKGDEIIPSQVFRKLSESRDLIYNTTLFSIVELFPIFGDSNRIVIKVNLVERWYIYPSPVFKLADRNFNEWYKTHNAELERVTYGVKFSHNNLSGRGDELNIYLLNGYSRNFTVGYSLPYANKRLTLGISFRAGYLQNREVAYKTSYYNKSLTYKNNYLDKSAFYVGGTIKYRRSYYKSHYFSLLYTYIKVNDTLLSQNFNPNYFNLNKSEVSLLDLNYKFQNIKTDNINFPLKGKIYEIGISKRGFGITGGLNMLSLGISYSRYYKQRHDFYTSFEAIANVKLPFNQPYINQGAMGYGNFYLSGLEYYVIDGVANGIAKFKAKKKIFDVKIPLPVKSKTFPYIPLTIFAKTFVNTGFAYNKKEYETQLNNRILGTYGLGIDILSLYDVNLNLEYSFNQLGEKGLFLHFKGSL
jgi:hypothetical protein